MYRPNNWQKILSTRHGAIAKPDAKLIEAGADCMLIALWELADASPTKTFTFDANMQYAYARIFDKA